MLLVDKTLDYFRDHGTSLALGLLAAVAIVLGTFVLGRAVGSLFSRALRRRGGVRGETLAPIVKTLTLGVFIATGCITALDHVGVDVATILAGAGILGLAIGFGAQTLVKDCLSGFFLILDHVLAQGDIAQVDGVSGTVEEVGLRVTRIRAFSGQLWYVPNGEIARVGNWNRDWVRAVVEVGVAYEQDARKGLQVLQKVGEQWASEHREVVLEAPEAQGVMGLNSSDVGLRLVIKMSNQEKGLWGAERELRLRIKEAFDKAGVEIPFPRQVTYHRQEDGQGFKVATGSSSQHRPAA